MLQLALLLALPVSNACSQSQAARIPTDRVAIVPRPVKVVADSGSYWIARTTALRAGPGTEPVARMLAGYLAPATGGAPDVRADRTPAAPGGIQLRLDPALAGLGAEGYRLVVRPDGIRITASAPAGLFYGVQTLRQLLPAETLDTTTHASNRSKRWTVPAVTIEDRPRFAWRGMHLDVSRHFMPKDVVKRYIDQLAFHKMNVFHWHLTDDQGWRLEIRKYPRLTQVGGFRKETLIGWRDRADSTKDRYDGTSHGGFYTQADAREIVAYAKDRFITVVPEIEMPGHAQAAIAAYPQLGVTGDSAQVWTRWGVSSTILNPEESTVRFMQDVLAEVLELFPSPFIHVGGDEAEKSQWKASPRVQQLIRERNVGDEHGMQSWFIHQMDSWLTARGRRLIGWDEILEGGLAPGAAVMSWRGTQGGIAAAQAGHDVVMAPSSHTYYDSYQTESREKEPGEPLAINGFVPLDRAYAFDPLEGLAPQYWPHVLGAQAQLWSEYIPDEKNLQWKAWPRAAALAEVVWTPADRRDWSDFLARLDAQARRWDAMGVNYRKGWDRAQPAKPIP